MADGPAHTFPSHPHSHRAQSKLFMFSIFNSLTFPHALWVWFYSTSYFESFFNVLNTFWKVYHFTVCSFPQEPNATHTSHRQAQQPVLYLVNTQDNTQSTAYLPQASSTASLPRQQWHINGKGTLSKQRGYQSLAHTCLNQMLYSCLLQQGWTWKSELQLKINKNHLAARQGI